MENYSFEYSDFVSDLRNLFMVRKKMSISESSRAIVDLIINGDIDIAVQDGTPAQEFFNDLDEENE